MRFISIVSFAFLFIGFLAVSCTKNEFKKSEPSEACFEVDSEESLENAHAFEFYSCSDHAMVHAWDFGDGQTSTHTSPTHVYSEYGTYEVTLTITTEMGAHLRETKTVKYGHYGIESLSFREVKMGESKSPPYYYTGCYAGVRAMDGFSAKSNMSYSSGFNGTGAYHPIPEKTTLETGIEYVLESSPTNWEVLQSFSQVVKIDLSETLEYRDIEFVWNASKGSKIMVDVTFKKVFEPDPF